MDQEPRKVAAFVSECLDYRRFEAPDLPPTLRPSLFTLALQHPLSPTSSPRPIQRFMRVRLCSFIQAFGRKRCVGVGQPASFSTTIPQSSICRCSSRMCNSTVCDKGCYIMRSVFRRRSAYFNGCRESVHIVICSLSEHPNPLQYPHVFVDWAQALTHWCHKNLPGSNWLNKSHNHLGFTLLVGLPPVM